MEASASSPRILVVAHRTAATPRLIEAVRQRAARGPCAFTLLVPKLADTAPEGEAERTLALAIPLLEEAAGGRVEGLVGPTDAVQAVEQAHREHSFDEAIISTLPETVSHWLKRDLPSRVERMGLPVTVVKADPSAVPRFAELGRA
jgi:hypothetical protein